MKCWNKVDFEPPDDVISSYASLNLVANHIGDI